MKWQKKIITSPEYAKRLQAFMGAVRAITDLAIQLVNIASRLKESDPKKSVLYEQDMRHLFQIQDKLNKMGNVIAYRGQFGRWPD